MASNSTVKRRGKKTHSASRGGNGQGVKAARTTVAVQGARVHNLKDISLEIPRDRLIVVTGLSGSGKSSLAFDTIYAEGQRRYMESLSSYAKRFVSQVTKPDVDFVFGLSPVIRLPVVRRARSSRRSCRCRRARKSSCARRCSRSTARTWTSFSPRCGR